MKLEVGMYVRTKNGIAKIRSFNGNEKKEYDKFSLDNDIIEDDGLYHDIYNYEYYLSQIVKASHNIIDLIEVGDYVNGVRIDELSHNRFTNAKAVTTNNSLRKDTSKQYWFENEDIKSIVTKEQFEAMKYEIK